MQKFIYIESALIFLVYLGFLPSFDLEWTV